MSPCQGRGRALPPSQDHKAGGSDDIGGIPKLRRASPPDSSPSPGVGPSVRGSDRFHRPRVVLDNRSKSLDGRGGVTGGKRRPPPRADLQVRRLRVEPAGAQDGFDQRVARAGRIPAGNRQRQQIIAQRAGLGGNAVGKPGQALVELPAGRQPSIAPPAPLGSSACDLRARAAICRASPVSRKAIAGLVDLRLAGVRLAGLAALARGV